MSNTYIEFHKGLYGSGVIISITYQKSRVICDFGAPYEPQSQVFDNIVRQRINNRVKDAIVLGLTPAIDGVYDEESIEGLDIVSAQKDDTTTGIVISHLHLDHMANIDFIHPSIPVYIHKDGYNLLQALIDIKEEVHQRNYTPIELHLPFNIGEITVTSYFSDHPCLGACGYLIETPDKTIYYSGDIRFHGIQHERAYQELTLFLHKNIDLLLIDGTTYSKEEFIRNTDNQFAMNIPTKEIPQQAIWEQDIYDELLNDLSRSDKLAIFNIYHRDMQLIESLINVCKKCNRTIVFEPKTAYVIYKIMGLKVPVFTPDNDFNEDYFLALSNHEHISAKDINIDPGLFFVQNSYEHLLELLSLPTKDADYYHLFGLPLVPSEHNYQMLLSLLKRMQLNFHTYTNLYSFNHAYPGNLRYMIEKIAAKMVVAVHSRKPENLVTHSGIHILPKENTLYRIDDKTLTEIEKRKKHD